MKVGDIAVLFLPIFVLVTAFHFARYFFFFWRRLPLSLRALTGSYEDPPVSGRVSMYTGFLLLLGSAFHLGVLLLLGLWIYLYPGSLFWWTIFAGVSATVLRSESMLGSQIRDDEGSFNLGRTENPFLAWVGRLRLSKKLAVAVHFITAFVLPAFALGFVFTYFDSLELGFSGALPDPDADAPYLFAFALPFGLGIGWAAFNRFWTRLWIPLGTLLFFITVCGWLLSHPDHIAIGLDRIVAQAFTVPESSFIVFILVAGRGLVYWFGQMRIGTGIVSHIRPWVESRSDLRFGLVAHLIGPLGLLLLWPWGLYLQAAVSPGSPTDFGSFWSILLTDLNLSFVVVLVLLFWHAAVFLAGLQSLKMLLVAPPTAEASVTPETEIKETRIGWGARLLLGLAVIVACAWPVFRYAGYGLDLPIGVWQWGSAGLNAVLVLFSLPMLWLFWWLCLYYGPSIRRYTKTFISRPENRRSLFNHIYLLVLSVLPKKMYSHLVGFFAGVKWPKFLLLPFLRFFARTYQINLDEAELNLADYKTVNAFFTRALKNGLRLQNAEENVLTSPVDGRILEFGPIAKDTMLQVKGKSFKLSHLLESPYELERFENGSFCTIYLSPQDYHRIHSPVSGQITGYYYVPGKLFPVNQFAVWNLQSVFSKNERVTSYIKTQYGYVAVVKVGAAAVGRIRLAYTDSFYTNRFLQKSRKKGEIEVPDEELLIQRGDEIGRFELGSTVILILEKGMSEFLSFDAGDRVKLGQPLAILENPQ